MKAINIETTRYLLKNIFNTESIHNMNHSNNGAIIIIIIAIIMI